MSIGAEAGLYIDIFVDKETSSWPDEDARAARKLAVRCAPKGVLTAPDMTVLERWARNYAIYRKIGKKVEAEDLVTAEEKGLSFNPAYNALVKIQ